jgi:leader peptidase (prepilin peptidase)/N-methyltransferase
MPLAHPNIPFPVDYPRLAAWYSLITFASALGIFPSVMLMLLGFVVGSFLNVVIARVPRELSIVRPGSHCPDCGHSLAWYENIPLLSWLALRGRCSTCRAPISWRYPVVELLTGLLFLACLRRFDWSWELASALMLVTLLLPLTFIDLEHWLLPLTLTLPGVAFGLLFSIPQGLDRLGASALGAVAGFLAFWALEMVGEKLFKKEALGGGDKYLLAMIGSFLTYRSLLGVVFLASLQGAVAGAVSLLLFGRAAPGQRAEANAELVQSSSPAENPNEPAPVEGSQEDDWHPGPTHLPFGPWLSLAAIELMLLGPWLAELVPWRAVQILIGV